MNKKVNFTRTTKIIKIKKKRRENNESKTHSHSKAH